MRNLGFVLLCLIAPAFADTITLDDGRVLDGKVEKREDGQVTIRLEKARIVLPEERVKHVEPAPLPSEAYALLSREVKDTPDARMALARWCKAKGLDAEAKEQALAVLALDSEYAEAREALGYRKVGGIWMSAEDQARLTGEPSEDVETVEGEFDGWTPDHKALYVKAKEEGWMDPRVRRRVRVGVPLVTLEMRPTTASLESMGATVMSSSNVIGYIYQPPALPIVLYGPPITGTIETPVLSLGSNRANVQAAAYP